MKVILKPGGLTIFAGVVVIVSTVIARKSVHPTSAVGAVLGTNAPISSEIVDPGEREEKAMMNEWNENVQQARDWLFLGPLLSGSQIDTLANNDNAQAQMDRIVNTPYLPNEAKYSAQENATFTLHGKKYTWRKVHGSAFDFKELFATPEAPRDTLKNVVVYGVTSIHSAKAEKKIMHFRSDDGAIVWLNGKQIFKQTKIRGVREEDKIPITLHAGRNSFLVKVGQGEGGWGMVLQLEDPS